MANKMSEKVKFYCTCARTQNWKTIYIFEAEWKVTNRPVDKHVYALSLLSVFPQTKQFSVKEIAWMSELEGFIIIIIIITIIINTTTSTTYNYMYNIFSFCLVRYTLGVVKGV